MQTKTWFLKESHRLLTHTTRLGCSPSTSIACSWCALRQHLHPCRPPTWTYLGPQQVKGNAPNRSPLSQNIQGRLGRSGRQTPRWSSPVGICWGRGWRWPMNFTSAVHQWFSPFWGSARNFDDVLFSSENCHADGSKIFFFNQNLRKVAKNNNFGHILVRIVLLWSAHLWIHMWSSPWGWQGRRDPGPLGGKVPHYTNGNLNSSFFFFVGGKAFFPCKSKNRIQGSRRHFIDDLSLVGPKWQKSIAKWIWNLWPFL